MRKSLIAALAAVMIGLTSCATTVRLVKPGSSLKADAGYLAITFMKRTETLALGMTNVYVHILHLASNGNIYIPIGSSKALRLIELAPGDYRIKDFVYMTGVEAIKSDGAAEKEGVYYGKPEIAGTSLALANFPEDYCKDFQVNAGEIVFIGTYSWEEKISLLTSGITIVKSDEDADSVGDAITERYPNIPETMKLVPLPE